MKKLNILVFPCGSEVGLEIYRSISYSRHLNIFGASSVDDHGKFVYKNYIGGLPFINSAQIIPQLKKIIVKFKIDAIYPTMDMVIWKLKKHETELDCKVIASKVKTAALCLSKRKIYAAFSGKIKTPKIYSSIKEIKKYPVFLKPDVGYGSRQAVKLNSGIEAKLVTRQLAGKKYLLLEYLSGEEYTVDCFTNRNRELLYIGPRLRRRITNGISVNTSPVVKTPDFSRLAKIINQELNLRGAWFFQVKRDNHNRLTLLEVATRLGGSSALNRMKGVNFALLSIFDAFDIDVKINTNNYLIQMDRALGNKYQTSLNYSVIYVDWDDCLLINNQINWQLVAFLYRAVNKNNKIILITKSTTKINSLLKKFKLISLFDQVIQLDKSAEKYRLINPKKAIFIDDSFSEREMVALKLKIPTFSPDMMEGL
jgi:hypothetical protein